MLMNYPLMKTLMRDHQNQIDEDIKTYRLLKSVKPSRPKMKDRLLLIIGQRLVAAGSKLQKRVKPALEACKCNRAIAQ
jgi:hypothetical protein